MSRKTVPAFLPMDHVLNFQLGLNTTPAVTAPHYLSELSNLEKRQLMRSSALERTFQDFLLSTTNDVTRVVEKLLKTGQYDIPLLTNRQRVDVALHRYGYEFVGLSSQSFFHWSNPFTVQGDLKNGTWQLDWHGFCADYGLGIHHLLWDQKHQQVRATSLSESFSGSDLITRYFASNPQASGMEVLSLLEGAAHHSGTPDHKQLALYLKESRTCDHTFKSLFCTYKNLAFEPHGQSRKDGDVREIALKDFGHRINPGCSRKVDWVLSPPKFQQFILVQPDLAAHLKRQGADILQIEDILIWGRLEGSPANPSLDSQLLGALIQMRPDLLDEVIREVLPITVERIEECRRPRLPRNFLQNTILACPFEASMQSMNDGSPALRLG